MSKVKYVILKVYNICKNWVVDYNIKGVISLLLGLLLWLLSQKILAGIAFGVFFTENWVTFKKWVLSKFK
jgi:hypothetical protein